ncbi:MAG: diguanylate cyclase [Cyanobacteriota bacterium]
MFNIKAISSKYPKTTTAITCFIALILFTAAIKLISFDQTIDSFELKTLDWRFEQTQTPEKIDNRIILVVLDDLSLQKAESKPELMLSNHINPDQTTANIINFLSYSGAKVIAFNNKFEGSKLDLESSTPFLEAIKKANNVYFPVVFSYSYNTFVETLSKDKEIQKLQNPEAKMKILNHLRKELLEINSETLRNELADYKLDVINEDLFSSFKYRRDIEYLTFGPIFIQLLQDGKGIGAINVSSDEDGVLREIIPIFSYNQNLYPSLALSTVRAFLPQKDSKLEFLPDGNLKMGNKVLPINKNGKIMIKWMAPTGGYTHYRMCDVLESYFNIQNDETPLLDPKLFKDKIVIVGETFAGPNKLTIPVSKAISGTEVQASIIDNLLNRNNFITKPHPVVNFLIALLFSFVVSIAVMKLKSGFSVVFTYGSLFLGYIALALLLFGQFSTWIEIIYPLGFMTIVFITTFLIKYTILSKAYEDTFQLAIKDGLTNLYNHKYFQETLARDLLRAKRHDDRISLLMIDIDHFKKFNDSYGHRAGDAILRQVAQTLRKSVRTSDLVARYGGEEMAIILYNANYDNSLLVAHKLRNIINDTVFLFKDSVYKEITISIGLANYPEHADSSSQLIEIADQALYFAKNNGRNQVGTYEQINEKIS